MSATAIRTVAVLLALTAAPAFAGNCTFQQTCSNIDFAYSGDKPAIEAMCLRANGTPNKTSLILTGISNQNGKLTQGGGASSFQESCGNVAISVDSGAEPTAFCCTISGSSEPTSLPLENISNQNGSLTQ
jgi:hypothetical protein